MKGLILISSVKQKFDLFAGWHKFGVAQINFSFFYNLPIFFQFLHKSELKLFSHPEILLLFHVCRIYYFLQFKGSVVLNNQRPECLSLVGTEKLKKIVLLLSAETRQLKLPKVFDLAVEVHKVIERYVHFESVRLILLT